MSKIGTLIFSFDVELAWGSIENGRCFKRDGKGLYIRTQRLFKSIVNLLDTYKISATFGFVGGMLAKRQKDICLDYLPKEIRDKIGYPPKAGQAVKSGFLRNDQFTGKFVNHDVIVP